MILNISKLSIASLVLMSASVLASVTTTDAVFSSSNSSVDFNNTTNRFSLTAGGIDINVSGWSDTKNFSGGSANNPLTGDDKIREADSFDEYRGGWALINDDEDNISFTGECRNHHAADNYDSCGTQDYDMFLIEFSEEVNLLGASFSWIREKNNTQVTVAALSDNTLLNRGWDQVSSNQTISSGYADVQSSSGYYSSFTETEANVDGTFSQFWLVGALNSIFGGNISLEGNDALKLSGVSFSVNQGKASSVVSVPEPSTIIMFGLALFGFAIKRKMK